MALFLEGRAMRVRIKIRKRQPDFVRKAGPMVPKTKRVGRKAKHKGERYG